MFIDTHCHLHDREFFSSEQAEAMLTRARENDVQKIICIGTNPTDSQNARQFASEHKDVYWSYGIHPEFASDPKICENLPASDALKHTFSDGGELEPGTSMPCAIGEIGLDYHYPGYDRSAQIKLFEQMLQLATDLDLPVSLHLREAFVDAFAILDNFPRARGVLHSFTGSRKDLRRALERGFFIGVNGLLTYTTPPLPPLERIVLETDAPFLTPVPFRGTINEPSYVRNIATYLADKMGVAESKIREQTTQNARKIFQI